MDQYIIEKLFQRDESGLQSMMDQYGSYCTSIAYHILSNHEDSEECVNDAMLKVWDTIPPNRPSSLGAYLAKITRNIAINHYRKEHAQKRDKDQIAHIMDELETIVGSHDDIDEQMDYNELVRTINEFLKSLSKEKRILFVRRYFYADSIEEIAVAYSMSKNHVSVSLHRTTNQLKKYLKERGYVI